MTTKTDELKHRVAAKRKDLEARLERLRADAAGARTDAVKKTEDAIRSLDDAARQGFDNITDKSADAINELLKRF